MLRKNGAMQGGSYAFCPTASPSCGQHRRSIAFSPLWPLFPPDEIKQSTLTRFFRRVRYRLRQVQIAEEEEKPYGNMAAVQGVQPGELVAIAVSINSTMESRSWCAKDRMLRA